MAYWTIRNSRFGESGICMERGANPLGCLNRPKRGSFSVLFCFLFLKQKIVLADLELSLQIDWPESHRYLSASAKHWE